MDGCLRRNGLLPVILQAQRIFELADQLRDKKNRITLQQQVQTISRALPPELSSIFNKLATRKTDKPVDHRRWIIGRLYLLAGSLFIRAAIIELERNKIHSAIQSCEEAIKCLKSSVPQLPQWEQSSVVGYLRRLKALRERLPDDKEYTYSLVHLKAVHAKVEKHALFIPPEPISR